MRVITTISHYKCDVFYSLKKNIANNIICNSIKSNHFVIDNGNCVKCFIRSKGRLYNIISVTVKGKKLHPFQFYKYINSNSNAILKEFISKEHFEKLYTSGMTLEQIAKEVKVTKTTMKNFWLKNYLAFDRLKLKKIHFNNINNNDKINVDIGNTI